MKIKIILDVFESTSSIYAGNKYEYQKIEDSIIGIDEFLRDFSLDDKFMLLSDGTMVNKDHIVKIEFITE